MSTVRVPRAPSPRPLRSFSFILPTVNPITPFPVFSISITDLMRDVLSCRCALTELSFQSTCLTCPAGGSCDGSATLLCEQGYYQTDDGQGGVPSCQFCPAGGTCNDNVFTPKVEGSTWLYEQDTAGSARLVRVASCPPGFSLLRSQNNPLGDTCDRCTEEFYNLDGSVYITDKDTSSHEFCLNCPMTGAICPVLLHFPCPPSPFLCLPFT